jgi:hypothetical protein
MKIKQAVTPVEIKGYLRGVLFNAPLRGISALVATLSFQFQYTPHIFVFYTRQVSDRLRAGTKKSTPTYVMLSQQGSLKAETAQHI